MKINIPSAFLIVTILNACSSPTAEQTTSAWMGTPFQEKKADFGSCEFLMTTFNLSKRDCLMIQQTLQHALEYAPDEMVSTWQNPQSGNSGTVIVTQSQLREENIPVRHYQMQIKTSAETKTLEGYAQRSPQGTWSPYLLKK